MKGTYVKGIKPLALRSVAWVSKGTLLCLGLLAMIALLVVMGVLTAVMLMATILPAPAVWKKRDLRGQRDSTNTSAPRKKAVAS